MKKVSNKKEREKIKQQKRKDKQNRKDERSSRDTRSFDEMIAYVDENGVLHSTPQELSKKTIELEDIQTSTPRQTDEPVQTSYKGRVEFYNPAKGFGFIKDLGSNEKYFFHVSEVLGNILEGCNVLFEIENGVRGKNAVRISII